MRNSWLINVHESRRISVVGDKERHASFLEGRKVLISSSSRNLWSAFLRWGIGRCSQFDGVCGNVFPSVFRLIVQDWDSRNWHSWQNSCRRTINVPEYNAIICYRLSPSTIELRAYYYRTGAFLTLDYFCHGQMFT